MGGEKYRYGLKMMRCFPSQSRKVATCRGAPGDGEGGENVSPQFRHGQRVPPLAELPYALLPHYSPRDLRALYKTVSQELKCDGDYCFYLQTGKLRVKGKLTWALNPVSF